MTIDARKLRDRVTIEAENLIDNGKGGRTRPSGQDAWKAVDTVWAECLALRGSEALQSVVERSKQLWRVTIRPRGDVTTSMRLTWHDAMIGDVVANIRSVAPNDDRDAFVMTVESGRS